MAASRNSRSADLAERVGAFVAARCSADERLCVGLSGGCDSVVLLHALVTACPGRALSAVHVNHGLSPNAAGWAAFCIDYAGSLGVPLVVREVAVDAASGLGIEAAARQARYAAFAEHEAECLLLAQHRGDQAETLLLNLLRGAGVTGAAAMPSERSFGEQRILRPLLDFSRADIEAYARQHGLSWVDDESNGDTGLTRNFLRHEVLTVVHSRFPGAEAALAGAAGHFAEAASLLDELAAYDWRRVAEGDAARLAGLRELSSARLRNLLRWRLRQLGWQVPVASRLDEFVRQVREAAADRHPELVLPAGRMRCGRGRLLWLPAK